MDCCYVVEVILFDLRCGEILCIIGEFGLGKLVMVSMVMGFLLLIMKVVGGWIIYVG